MRVAVVEDHLIFRDVLRRIVGDAGHDVVWEAASIHHSLELATSLAFDIVLSDLMLADGDGCVMLRQLRRKQPAFRVLVV